MAEGGINQEEISGNKSKWVALKEFGQRLLRRQHSVAKQKESFPNINEKVSVPPNSGYENLVRGFAQGVEIDSVSTAKILTEEYPDLISTVNADGSLDGELKETLLSGIKEGNIDVIAIISARLLKKLIVNKNDPALKDKIKKVNFLSKKAARYFVDREVYDPSYKRFTDEDIKKSWAVKAYHDAVENPRWRPVIRKQSIQTTSKLF